MEEHNNYLRIGLLDVVLNHLSYMYTLLRYKEMTKNWSFVSKLAPTLQQP